MVVVTSIGAGVGAGVVVVITNQEVGRVVPWSRTLQSPLILHCLAGDLGASGR